MLSYYLYIFPASFHIMGAAELVSRASSNVCVSVRPMSIGISLVVGPGRAASESSSSGSSNASRKGG